MSRMSTPPDFDRVGMILKAVLLGLVLQIIVMATPALAGDCPIGGIADCFELGRLPCNACTETCISEGDTTTNMSLQQARDRCRMGHYTCNSCHFWPPPPVPNTICNPPRSYWECLSCFVPETPPGTMGTGYELSDLEISQQWDDFAARCVEQFPFVPGPFAVGPCPIRTNREDPDLCDGDVVDNCAALGLATCGGAPDELRLRISGTTATCRISCGNMTLTEETSCEMSHAIAQCVDVCFPGCLTCTCLTPPCPGFMIERAGWVCTISDDADPTMDGNTVPIGPQPFELNCIIVDDGDPIDTTASCDWTTSGHCPLVGGTL